MPALHVRSWDLAHFPYYSKVKNEIFKTRYIHFVQAAYRVRTWDLVKFVQAAYRVRSWDLAHFPSYSKVKNQIFKTRYIHFVQDAYCVRLWDLVKFNDTACATFYKNYHLAPKMHMSKKAARRDSNWDLVKIMKFPSLE